MVEFINGLIPELATINRVRQRRSAVKSKWIQCSFQNSTRKLKWLRTQSRTDDKVSLNASNLWFRNNANDPRDNERVSVKNNNIGSKAVMNMKRRLAMNLKCPRVKLRHRKYFV